MERMKASLAIKIRRITVNNFSNFYLSKLITKRSSPSNLKRPFKEDLEKESFNLKKTNFDSDRQPFARQQKQNNITKFAAELTKNVDLYHEIYDLGKK